MLVWCSSPPLAHLKPCATAHTQASTTRDFSGNSAGGPASSSGWDWGGAPSAWGLGWALHGATGRVWDLAEAPPTLFHHELGLSLTLLDYLNVEYTRRLDHQEGHWSLSAKKAF